MWGAAAALYEINKYSENKRKDAGKNEKLHVKYQKKIIYILFICSITNTAPFNAFKEKKPVVFVHFIFHFHLFSKNIS